MSCEPQTLLGKFLGSEEPAEAWRRSASFAERERLRAALARDLAALRAAQPTSAQTIPAVSRAEVQAIACAEVRRFADELPEILTALLGDEGAPHGE